MTAESTDTPAAALVAGWLCLLTGAIGSAGLSMTTELLEADAARSRAATVAAELAAIETEADGWGQIAASLRNDRTFRDEWARRELPGLRPEPRGLVLAADARVDLRRPPTATVEPVPLAPWRPLVERLAASRWLPIAAIGLMLVGVFTAAPRRLIGRGPLAYFRSRYRIDSRHPLDPPHVIDVDPLPVSADDLP